MNISIGTIDFTFHDIPKELGYESLIEMKRKAYNVIVKKPLIDALKGELDCFESVYTYIDDDDNTMYEILIKFQVENNELKINIKGHEKETIDTLRFSSDEIRYVKKLLYVLDYYKNNCYYPYLSYIYGASSFPFSTWTGNLVITTYKRIFGNTYETHSSVIVIDDYEKQMEKVKELFLKIANHCSNIVWK